ncbi:MAG: hypothetical protein M3407_02260 [Acidobacteriota bacterium]|nr:hypothetical protein [Acidobacteriota bacterium]
MALASSITEAEATNEKAVETACEKPAAAIPTVKRLAELPPSAESRVNAADDLKQPTVRNISLL